MSRYDLDGTHVMFYPSFCVPQLLIRRPLCNANSSNERNNGMRIMEWRQCFEIDFIVQWRMLHKFHIKIWLKAKPLLTSTYTHAHTNQPTFVNSNFTFSHSAFFDVILRWTVLINNRVERSPFLIENWNVFYVWMTLTDAKWSLEQENHLHGMSC